MRLEVHWVNATRPPIERTRIELTYRDALLSLFNGVENASKARNIYISHRSPHMDWARFNRTATQEAVRFLTPTEAHQARFQVLFH